MQTPNLIDTMFQTVQATISESPAMFVILLIFGGIGLTGLIHELRKPPRFDPMRHMERPPIEGRPNRSLPPASAYIDWERQQDKEKDGLPWN